ncbi:MAG: glycoside hydrolase family 16 protein [Ruminococcaceae bacterium]|nr:glycoside hydrolase family 16 protein [Oscillospiraceae bacterium]
MKRYIAITLCFILSISLFGCRKINPTDSSFYSTGSNILPTTSSDNTSSDSASLGDDSSSTQTDSSSTNNQSSQTFEEKYGFNRLVDVEYECLKEIPGDDAQYEVKTVTTDTGYAFIYAIFLSCDDKSIIIKDRTVTVPFEYRQKHDSVTLTATHNLAKVSTKFTITFDKWDLVFEENFDGTELNTDIWNVWDEKRDWHYSYSKDAMFLDGNGNLINRMTSKDNPTSPDNPIRTSGAITTQGKYETTYGYFEVSMKPHKATGLMGAFWLMCGDMGDPNAANDGTAVNGCEVDIIETFYHNLNPSQTIHWDGYTHTKSKSFNKTNSPEIFDGNYHTFGFLWTPEEYVFFIDGEVNARTDEMGICNQPGYLLISSHFNDEAGEFSVTQTDMAVDYVRVYKTDALK